MYVSYPNAYGDINGNVDHDTDTYPDIDIHTNVDPNVDGNGNPDSNRYTDVDRDTNPHQHAYDGVGHVLFRVLSFRWNHLLVRQER